MSLNKEMGDAHEEFLAELFDGHQTRGSGNQWANPIDGRQSRRHVRFAFAWDGKSTLGASLSISMALIAKAKEQAGGERPMIGLRWYKTERLEVKDDWVAVKAYDMAEVVEAANKMARIEEQGCLNGMHLRIGTDVCSACGASAYDGT